MTPANEVRATATTRNQGGQGAPLLEVNRVTKAYGGVPALRGVSLRLELGSIHAVIGHNGAGKSTVMRILSGATKPNGGTIAVVGRSVHFASPRDAQTHGIAMVHQELSVIDDLDVAENICLTQEPRRFGGFIDRSALDARARDVLAKLDLRLDLRTRCGKLSMAERQMVEIAHAVSLDARVLILDEPTAALTRKEQDALFSLLRRLKSQIGIFYISHRLDEIVDLADEVTVLRDGCDVAHLPAGSFDHRALVEAMLGRHVEVSTAAPYRAGEEPMLEVEDLRHGTNPSQGVSFSIGRGEIVGIAGMLGSGRSELLECLFGLRKARSGTVRLDGATYAPAGPVDAMAAGVALVPEDRKAQGIFAGAPLWRNVALASFHDLFKRAGFVDRGRARDATQTQVRSLDIRTASIDLDVALLSGGNQQKAVIARWLLRHPKLLMLDEPTAGIDIGAKSEIHELVRRLATEGVAIIAVSSEFDELIALCHRIVVMRDGGIVAEVPGSLARESELVVMATGGTLGEAA